MLYNVNRPTQDSWALVIFQHIASTDAFLCWFPQLYSFTCYIPVMSPVHTSVRVLVCYSGSCVFCLRPKLVLKLALKRKSHSTNTLWFHYPWGDPREPGVKNFWVMPEHRCVTKIVFAHFVYVSTALQKFGYQWRSDVALFTILRSTWLVQWLGRSIRFEWRRRFGQPFT